MTFNKNLVIGLTLGIFIGMLGIAQADGTAGTTTDPLVTVSYMEMKLKALDDKYLTEVNALKTQIEQMNQGGSSTTGSQVFEIISIPKGNAVYFADSAEFIVRVGNANVIDPNAVGIPDLTEGSKVLNGKRVPIDHHMLVPSNDGRGILTTEDCWMMIKGNYTMISNN
ncbi:hypothetical protein [Fusibacter sp. 3D3]|uniref:hypothetical protein n=1 Tax=Fusibacter sp. 3D3 TaxID=1048380 RepID=UPI000853A08F|nr:hypothetical protein [Fusibacter sp. 3D3]GAU78002.1 hypothetical protein F3D3_2631 [Fusibacter sp. 3D3]